MFLLAFIRKLIFIASVPAFLIGCHSWASPRVSKATKAPDSTTIQKNQIPPYDSNNSRSVLIKELKKLNAIFASNDRNKIRQLFRFPLSDSLVSVYIEDSSFDVEKEKNGGKITETMFQTYFPQLSKAWRLKELNLLFKHLPLDELETKNKLKYIAKQKKDPCLKQYFIEIQDSIVIITYGINSNPDYKAVNKKDDDEIDAVCEYDTIWEFSFDGKSLVFRRQLAAG